MGRQIWKPGNMLYPVPAVLVSVAGDEGGRPNLITIAWTGTVCSDPAMTYISVRKSRYSHGLLMRSREFVINLVPAALAKELDYCGVVSGRDVDKFAAARLTPAPASAVSAPVVEECPVNIECRVTQVLELGSHDMFLAEVAAVQADERLIEPSGRLVLEKAGLISYNHGHYQAPGEDLGSFGFSVRKKHGGKGRR